MTNAWKQYKPKLAIYDILDKPGGVSVDVAMRRADQAVENHRGQAETALTEAIQKLDALTRAGGTGKPDEVYELATFVLDIAGIYHPSLCRAANSLCDLSQRMQAADRWDWPSVSVHVSSMRLLTDRKDENDPAVQAVLRGLGSVVAKFPDPNPPDPPKKTPSPA
jgi:hypothetical protein